MIPYRPIAPLTLGSRRGWKSVVTAVVMAALLGTTATSAVAAEGGASATAVQSSSSGQSSSSVQSSSSGQSTPSARAAEPSVS